MSQQQQQAISYSILLRLRNLSNTYQSAHITECHLPEKMTWLSMDRSHAGALTLQTLGEYCASVHTDIIHSVDQSSHTVPQVAKMINHRLGFQNTVSSV